MTEFVRRFCVGCQQTFATTYECTVHGITCESHLHMFEGSVYEKKVRIMMEKHKDAEIVARTCLGCEKVCKDQPSFYSHWNRCEKAKSVLKKPRGMVATQNGTIRKALETCRGCKQTFSSRNELHRHYCTCLKNLELFQGTDYYNQQKTFLERIHYDPKKAETTCPGCYTIFSSHRNLSAHRFHCTQWIQTSHAQPIKEKSDDEFLEEIKTSYEPPQPIEKHSFVALAKEKSKDKVKTVLDPKKLTDADFYVGLVPFQPNNPPTPTPTKPIMVSTETQTEKPSCIKFGTDQIKEIPNKESEEYILEKESIDSLSQQPNNNPPTIPIQIKGLWVRINNQVYYVPPQAVQAIAYLATPVPVPM